MAKDNNITSSCSCLDKEFKRETCFNVSEAMRELLDCVIWVKREIHLAVIKIKVK